MASGPISYSDYLASPPPPPLTKPLPSPPSPSNDLQSPPVPADQNASSSPSPSSPSDNGNDKRSPDTSGKWLSSPPVQYRLSASPGHNSNSGLPSSGIHGAELNPAVIGIAAGFVILLIAVILLVTARSRKKKKSDIPQYNRHCDGKKVNNYFKGASISNNEGQWSGGYKNNIGKQIHIISPPPGKKGWVITPPPPLPLKIPGGDMRNFSSSPQGTPKSPPQHLVALGFRKSNFTFDELSAATGGFAQANLIGQGGFGYVHKGVLPNCKEIAVKSLKSIGGQGEKEFKAEIEVISRVHHRHLVSLVGYCISEGKSLLVYEFVPNKTLEFHLHGKDRPVMKWSTRLKIAIGSAKGLAYLHEDCNPRIIHRDIKGANILIEDNFEAKVADFGLARLNQDNNTHISSRVMGTFGYLAPEYASSGKLTEKSDVFSFGVVLLELITGRRPIDLTGECEEDSLVEWARPRCAKAMESGNYVGLVDPRLENNYETQEMARMVASAAASVRRSARMRPKMSQIVRALEGDVSLEVLSEEEKRGQSPVPMCSNASSECDTTTYNKADINRDRKLALDI